MNQTKIESLIEAGTNIVIGFLFGVLTQLILFPLKGIEVSFVDNIEICLWFTSVSFLRTYLIRRWFNTYFKRFSKYIVRLYIKYLRGLYTKY